MTYNDKAIEKLIEHVELSDCPGDFGLKESKPCSRTIGVSEVNCHKCWQDSLQQEPKVQS